MVVLNKKLAAGTILETMVALTIVMISFGIALMIFNNVNKSSSNFQKMKASILLNEIAVDVKQNKLFGDNTIDQNGFLITQKIEPFENVLDIKVLYHEVRNIEGKLLAERKELIFMD